ncbi:MAG TPA: EAL domain-containing response regulator [Gammaproteobacteria bacterium]
MAANINRLLVVDHDRERVAAITAVAERLGFSVAETGGAGEFARLLDAFNPTVIVTALRLPDTDAAELLRLLAARDSRASIALVGDEGDRVLESVWELGIARGLSMLRTLPAAPAGPEIDALLRAARKAEREIGAEELGRALAAGELVPHFQPQVRRVGPDGWEVDGVEALVRWLHPRYGLVMPEEFVSVAERGGLMRNLTELVIAASLRALAGWQRDGLALKCAINLPPGLAADADFPGRLEARLVEEGLDPLSLTLEVTEAATLQAPTVVMDVLTRLRSAGVTVALDDFGTGYSSITRLYRMPFDEMKIDKSLVTHLPRSAQARAMIGSLIELGHNLGLEVCAEGVENAGALDLLAELGCDRCQGYFVSRALPGGQIPSFVRRWGSDEAPSQATRAVL